MKIKFFEVVLNDKPYAWKADKDTKIETVEVVDGDGWPTKTATITTKHPEHGKLVTTVDYTHADIVTIG